MKTRYDSGATGHHFKEGDQVWMYNPKRQRGLSPKLQQNWEGPYTIVKKLNDVIYRVQRSPNAKPKKWTNYGGLVADCQHRNGRIVGSKPDSTADPLRYACLMYAK
ncbi:hypothetical protein AVEN_165268-1 [Araneus ventricosus]|uniref:Integrase p58-like C-terminal domain-containing protein n=1 Tax=Araneus ventricosus TaxID=182803 RepID=A0A4Y2ATI9_ARAVE|nr:hypothetical protein AVEN_165268-1 [Araneus ventricosus]